MWSVVTVGVGWWLDLVIFKVCSQLNDSMLGDANRLNEPVHVSMTTWNLLWGTVDPRQLQMLAEPWEQPSDGRLGSCVQVDRD